AEADLPVSLQATVAVALAFFLSGGRRHTRFSRDWSSDVCSADLTATCGAARWASSRRPAPRTRSTRRGTPGPRPRSARGSMPRRDRKSVVEGKGVDVGGGSGRTGREHGGRQRHIERAGGASLDRK